MFQSRLEELFARYIADGTVVEVFDEATSTNDVIRGEKYPEGSVVVAERQTAGRGQRGNSWASEAGSNLTFSVLLEPEGLPAQQQFYISKIVTLALTDALTPEGIDTKIKWPNDIYAGDQKIAGILIENDLSGSSIKRSVIGIGLNVNQTEFHPSLPNPTSARQLTGKEHDRGVLLRNIYETLIDYYGMLAEGRFEEIDKLYAERLYRFGVPARYSEPGGYTYTGTITGVEPNGELAIAGEKGNIKKYLFKEVEFII